MANKHETLISLFTDIADAIREKTGDTENIIADNFPDEILNIQTKEDLDAELTEQERLLEELETILSSKAIPEEGEAWIPETQKLIVSYDCPGMTRSYINYVEVKENGEVCQQSKQLDENGTEEFTILKNSIFVLEENDGGGSIYYEFNYNPSNELIYIQDRCYSIGSDESEGSIIVTAIAM